MDKGIEKHDTTRPKDVRKAHGKPGDKPSWSSGAKTLVGTAASARSRIWYTVGNGTLNEVYFPDVDQANTRSVRFLVTDGETFFSDEEWDAEHTVEWMSSGVPGCHIESRCKAGRYTIVKDIITDPVRDTLMMRVKFVTSEPELKLYLFAEPQMGDRGANNNAWVGKYKSITMLIAQRERTCLAITSHPQLLQASCGYMGESDGCGTLARFEGLADSNVADNGNVSLIGEIDWKADDGNFTISLACGADPAEAAQQARAGILEDFEKTRELFIRHWQETQAQYSVIEDLSDHTLDMYRVSTACLKRTNRSVSRAHSSQASRFRGDLRAPIKISVGITCSGHATWWKQRWASWPAETLGLPAPRCSIFPARRMRTVRGARTCGLMEPCIGERSRWTAWRFPFCWRIRSGAKMLWMDMIPARWYMERPAFS
jgi:glucoamylase